MSTPPEITIDQLLDALLDADTTLQPRFLYRLSDIGGDELAQLSSHWHAISSQRRIRLLEDLEQLAEHNTRVNFDAICRLALQDEEPQARLLAIRSLWEVEDPLLASTLLSLLENDHSNEVRAQAVSGLGRFIYLGELDKTPQELKVTIEDKLLEIMASDAPPIIRHRALESLGYSQRGVVESLIEEAYEFGDDDWLVSALFVIGRSADVRWEPEVIDKLDHLNPAVRLEAVRAAGELALEEASPALLNLLHDAEDEIRIAAAWSLSEIGGIGIRQALETLLEETKNEEEFDLIEDALDNLAFNEDLQEFKLFDFSEDDLEDPPISPQNKD